MTTEEFKNNSYASAYIEVEKGRYRAILKHRFHYPGIHIGVETLNVDGDGATKEEALANLRINILEILNASVRAIADVNGSMPTGFPIYQAPAGNQWEQRINDKSFPLTHDEFSAGISFPLFGRMMRYSEGHIVSVEDGSVWGAFKSRKGYSWITSSDGRFEIDIVFRDPNESQPTAENLL